MGKIDIIVYVNKKEVLMNKEELVKEVAKKAKVSQKAAADVIAATLETVTKTVSKGQKYPEKKQRVMELVPMGGYWKDLPVATQKEYMGKSFYSGGGKTGMARRLSLDEPALTLTCSPSQKETERCHPTETRPLTIREYARIQTFPDTWEFAGAMSAQYNQIGNAVPVNLAYALGRSLIRLLNEIG